MSHALVICPLRMSLCFHDLILLILCYEAVHIVNHEGVAMSTNYIQLHQSRDQLRLGTDGTRN